MKFQRIAIMHNTAQIFLLKRVVTSSNKLDFCTKNMSKHVFSVFLTSLDSVNLLHSLFLLFQGSIAYWLEHSACTGRYQVRISLNSPLLVLKQVLPEQYTTVKFYVSVCVCLIFLRLRHHQFYHHFFAK